MAELAKFDTQWVEQDKQYRLFYVQDFPLGTLRTLIQIIPANDPGDKKAHQQITDFCCDFLEYTDGGDWRVIPGQDL